MWSVLLVYKPGSVTAFSVNPPKIATAQHAPNFLDNSSTMRSSLFILTVLVVLAVQCAESVSNDHSQCQSHGYLGACKTGTWIKWDTICSKLRCATATKSGVLHVSKSIGRAAVGTMCGISRACNAKHQCAPILNVPHQVGPTGSYLCKPEKV